MIQREDELIKQLAQLSLDKEAKDRENKDLMKQLEAMKARLEAREDDKCVQDEIERKLREKEERRRNVEKLRKERLKKQKEDEEMKIQKLNEGKRQAELVRIIVNYLYLIIAHIYISFSSYEQPIRIPNFCNEFFVYFLFEYFYKVTGFYLQYIFGFFGVF